jgi:hypothetical protein
VIRFSYNSYKEEETTMSDLDYAAIRRVVEKGIADKRRFYRKLFFRIHILFYLATMFIMWGIVIVNSQSGNSLYDGRFGEAAIVILPTVMWGFAVLCHAAALYIESSAGERALREKILTETLGEEIRRLDIYQIVDKPKRNNSPMETDRLVLTDDGELVYADENGDAVQAGAYRRV